MFSVFFGCEMDMSHLKCPLCGRLVSINYFDPSEFDADVFAVKYRGLGRGKGFEKSDEYSILLSGDPIIELIKERILGISKFFFG